MGAELRRGGPLDLAGQVVAGRSFASDVVVAVFTVGVRDEEGLPFGEKSFTIVSFDR
ncbi:MAG: hypothetical protein ACR2GF_01515 [Acidimicrobiales bacterium]